jgi:predicted RNA-binding Zn ribbon-like protein
MARKPPRYDLPNAAPEPLRQIQLFVNTIDLSHDREWLGAWFAERRLPAPGEAELEQARRLREAIRELLYANNGQGQPSSSAGLLSAAADSGRLGIDFQRGQLVARAPGLDGVLGHIAIIAYETMRDGSWRRLKCCRNHDCRWAFYDASKNRSATWCSMQICGNRSKTRRYRRRSQEQAPGYQSPG